MKKLFIRNILSEIANITRHQLQKMSDSEFIEYLQNHPYYSDWNNKDAVNYSEIRLSYIQSWGYLSSKGGRKGFRQTLKRFKRGIY